VGSGGRRPLRPSTRRYERGAFTLVEVMMAVAIFLMCMFAILSLVSQNLRAARSLTVQRPHAGMLAGQLALTNMLEEGVESGNFGDLFLPADKNEKRTLWEWQREIVWVGSNGLFQVHFIITADGQVDSELQVEVYKPQSTPPGLGLRR
jgi:prepilin-type N-terminal cleavage/methylation domain-containing protein